MRLPKWRDTEELARLLRLCSTFQDLRHVHVRISRSEYKQNRYLANQLISMYTKLGSVEHAVEVFNALVDPGLYSCNLILHAYAQNGHMYQASEVFEVMHQRDVFSWNKLLNGYVMQGEVYACQSLFDRMPQRSVVTWTAMLTAYAVRGDYLQEAKVLFDSMPERDLVAWTALLTAYIDAKSLLDARRVFNRIPSRNVVSWNALILGYAENGQGETALHLFSVFVSLPEGSTKDARSYVAAIKACSRAGESATRVECLDYGMSIHSQATGSCGINLFLASALVDFYSSCGSLLDARLVFDKASMHDVVLWNALVQGYVDNGEEETALKLFNSMENNSCKPDILTFVAAVKACIGLARNEEATQTDGEHVKLGVLEKGMDVHSRAEKLGLVSSSLSLSSCLMDMYAECGTMEDSWRVFQRSPQVDVVLWTSMILGCAANKQGELALEIFSCMPRESSCKPTSATFVAALKACSSCVALEAGKAIHGEIHGRCDHHRLEQVVETCLVDFYSKTGSLANAQLVFDCAERNLVTWNALIAGYSRKGNTEQVFHLFCKMEEESLKPDGITFLCVLTACSHAGLLDECNRCFKRMVKYGIQPVLEHYHCLVDLLGRANRLDEVVSSVESMPFQNNAVTWRTVLGACAHGGGGPVAYEWLTKPENSDYLTAFQNR